MVHVFVFLIFSDLFSIKNVLGPLLFSDPLLKVVLVRFFLMPWVLVRDSDALLQVVRLFSDPLLNAQITLSRLNTETQPSKNRSNPTTKSLRNRIWLEITKWKLTILNSIRICSNRQKTPGWKQPTKATVLERKDG